MPNSQNPRSKKSPDQVALDAFWQASSDAAERKAVGRMVELGMLRRSDRPLPLVAEAPGLCCICKRPLTYNTGNRLSDDCGGDCSACMYKIEGNLRLGLSDERLLEIMKTDDEFLMHVEITARHHLRMHRDPADAELPLDL